MRKLLLFIAFFTTLNQFAQKSSLVLHSSRMQEDREITVVLPPSYEKDLKKDFPLLVLLDGEYLLDPFHGALSFGAYWNDMPELIIVAVHQNKKGERYTDTQVNETTGLPQNKGGDFFEFIGQELMPELEKEFRISPLRVIAGHDVSAAYINFFLYKEKPIFNGYICLSPELTSGMEKQIPERLKARKQPVFYYLSTANGDLKKMQKRILELDSTIQSNTSPTLNYKFDNFANATHYSLILYSIPEAIYQLFAIYQPISQIEFTEKIAVLPSGYVDYLINKYDLIEKTLSIKMPIRYSDFKAIEAAIIKNKAYDEMQQLAVLALKTYPKSMLGDYVLALMFEKTQNYEKAVKFYKKAYQKEEIGDLTRDMMYNKMDELKNQ